MAKVFETPWFSVLNDERYTIDEVNGQTGAAVLVRDCDRRAAFVEIFRPAINILSLEVPRGFALVDEKPSDCAAREFQEETGYTVAGETLTHLGSVAPNTGLLTTRVQLFSGQIVGVFANPTATDGEVSRVVLLDPAQLDARLGRGEIICALTLSLLFLDQARTSRLDQF